MDRNQIDNIINQLSGNQLLAIERFESLIQQLCPVAVDIFSAEPTLLELQAPIKITGDLQYPQLETIFRYDISKYLYLGNYGERPPQSNHLYLGNYIDKRRNCLHTILLLLAFKIRHPKNLFLMKGNLNAWISHFCVDEVDEMRKITCKINANSERILYDCLNSLPVAALINDKIICAHGGLSPDLHSLDQIRHIKRPTNSPYSRLLLDLLRPHSRHLHRVGDIFVAKELQFLEKHDLRLICHDRHQAVSEKDFVEHRVVSMSSSPYRVEYGSKVSYTIMMTVDANLKCSFYDSLNRSPLLLWSCHILMPATIQNESSSRVNLACETPITNYGEDTPLGKSAERITKPSNGSSHPTITTKYENTPGGFPSTSKAASKNRSVSPGLMPAERMSKSDTGSTNGTGKPESSQQATRPLKIDPADLYRSKSPGVKRFLGARV